VQDFKVSLITITYNAESTIGRCIESVIAQNCKNLEYIIIDGGSTDNTLQIIDRYKNYIDILVSEPDKGVYDAMNKGILRATGDIIGTLNADDFFAGGDILNTVATAFAQQNADILYGDLDYM
jgi:glycosyltransferase involved in cell wall biosynthesis